MSGDIVKFDNCKSCGHTRGNHKTSGPRTLCFARVETTGSSQNCRCTSFEFEELSELDSRDPFDALLLEVSELHKRKKSDYSNPEDRFSNFKVAAEFAGIETYQTFEVLLGVKQARLQELMKPNGRTPQNESIEDTLMDRAVYSLLALLYWRDHK